MRTQHHPGMVTSSKTYYPPQPLWLRAVNRGSYVLQRHGVSFGQFDGLRLMEAACRHTGLHDFGTIPFQESLQLLLHSCEHEDQRNICGQMAVRHDILRLLRNLLCRQDDWKRPPGIAAQCIDRPLFIAGLPRTGTSLLHSLLAQDPANQTPLSWEVMSPSPPPEREHYESNSRIAHVERQMRCIDWLAPDFKRIHEVGARLPQECVAITSHIFRSSQFATTFHVPSYEAWIDKADLRPAYQFHRRFLQHLQWRCSGQQWVLKSPAHLAGLEALLGTYPDAGIIQPHRDPLVAIASLASLRTVLHSTFSHAVDPLQIGLETTTYWAQVLLQAIQFRRAHPAARRRFYDVYYHDLTSDPIGTVRRSYTPYKVANLVLEFSTSIPRTQLRPGYGDGFLGAPLHVVPASQSPIPQKQGDRRGTSSLPTAPDAGGSYRIESGHNSPSCVVQAYDWAVPSRHRPTPSQTLPTTQAGQLRPEQPVRRRDPA